MDETFRLVKQYTELSYKHQERYSTSPPVRRCRRLPEIQIGILVQVGGLNGMPPIRHIWTTILILR